MLERLIGSVGRNCLEKIKGKGSLQGVLKNLKLFSAVDRSPLALRISDPQPAGTLCCKAPVICPVMGGSSWISVARATLQLRSRREVCDQRMQAKRSLYNCRFRSSESFSKYSELFGKMFENLI